MRENNGENNKWIRKKENKEQFMKIMRKIKLQI